MSTFKTALSQHAQWQQAVDDCLHQLGEVSAKINLGFIYVTDALASELTQIVAQLKQQTGIAHWTGSVGLAIHCMNQEVYDSPAMAVMLGEFPPGSFQLFQHYQQLEGSHTAEDKLHVALIHADPRNPQVLDYLGELPEKLGNGFLVGGLTSAEQHYYQVADDVIEGDISGVVFSDLAVVTGLTQGCTPLGPVRTVTECEQHMAISIDNQPALDVFKQDMGEILARNIDRAAGYIFAGFPVSGSDTGDYLVRNIVGIDPEHGRLAIGEYMQTGQSIMFCKRDPQTAITDMQRMLDDVQRRIAKRKIRGGVYISCLGRGRNLFGENSDEIKQISKTLGEFPLLGFYANGEIAGQRLYGYTGVLMLFL